MLPKNSGILAGCLERMLLLLRWDAYFTAAADRIRVCVLGVLFLCVCVHVRSYINMVVVVAAAVAVVMPAAAAAMP